MRSVMDDLVGILCFLSSTELIAITGSVARRHGCELDVHGRRRDLRIHACMFTARANGK